MTSRLSSPTLRPSPIHVDSCGLGQGRQPRQDTRPPLIGQQLLDVDGNTAVQGGKESSYGFLEAFTNCS
jgi:hypothetical protein